MGSVSVPRKLKLRLGRLADGAGHTDARFPGQWHTAPAHHQLRRTLERVSGS